MARLDFRVPTSGLNVDGNLTVDTNSLFVDATNNRVGIGKTNPAQALDVVGNIAVTGTINGIDISSLISATSANVETAIEGITLTSVAGATNDEVLVVDATDGGLKAVLWQNLAVPAANVTGTTLASGVVTSSLTTVGALNAGSITSGFGNINNGASSITTTGTISGGTVTVSGDVAVNGGDLTTTATTFNLVNSTATTVNFAGAATALNIGNAAGTVTFAHDVTVTGDLIVNGTTTTVNSTVVTIDDPVFTLGGDTAPGSDDNKDRGIEFRWHNGTAAKVGFFGLDDSTGKFTFIPDATNTSEVFSGTKGTIDVGSVEATTLFIDSIEVDTTGATSNQVLQYNGTKFVPVSLSSSSAFGTVAVSGQSDVVADAGSDTLTLVAGSGITLTTDAGADSVTITNAGALNAFTTVAVSGQSSVVADSASDTLTLVAGSNITITTNATSDTVTITGPTPGGLAFGTVAVSGQSNVVADSTSDTLTLVNGTGVTITTDAGADSVTVGIGQAVATTSNVTFGSVSTSATENGGTATTLQRSSYDVTTATTQKVIESHAVSGHTTVKYLIQAVQGTSTVSTEILAVYNNSTVNYTEYATVLVGTLPATFEVTYSNSAIELKATAASSSSTTYRVFSTAIAA